MTNKIKIKRGTGTTPTLDVGEIAINLTNNKLSIGKSGGNINFVDETSVNTSLALKQNKDDTSLLTTSKTITGAINELKLQNTNDIIPKLPKLVRTKPTLESSIIEYDDTVLNEIVMDTNGIVTYSFCLTIDKSANSMANGVALCTIPSNIPIPKIIYGIVNIERVGGLRSFGMAIINATNKKILVYLPSSDSANFSAVKGTLTWNSSTP